MLVKRADIPGERRGYRPFVRPRLTALAPSRVVDLTRACAEVVPVSRPSNRPDMDPDAHTVTRAYRVTKRAIDAAGAALLLLLLSPVFLVVAVAVKLSSPGPVIYRQQRLGRGGTSFTMLKFRTMVADAERSLHEHGLYERYVSGGYKLDPAVDFRHTRVGSFLRRTSLDELPQLWNVLSGQMSLVGPRPVVPNEIALYGSLAHSYLSVSPGLTGLWQVSGRSTIGYPERCHIDLRYYEERSLRTDMAILLRTPFVVIRCAGAH